MNINTVQIKLFGIFFLIFIIFIILNYFQYLAILSGTSEIPLEMIFLVVAVIFSISVSSLAFIADSKITNRIVKLKGIADDIRMGNFRTRADVKSNDELGHLANAINEITINLNKERERNEKLEEHGRNLDKLIYTRTKELNERIDDLTQMKTAILNMMEDTDDTNVKLLVSQEKLKKSLTELKDLDVRKDQFISVAAHELKTPITAIKGFSDLLKIEKIATNSNERKKYLGIINSEIRRLGKLVDDILDLSRIDIGKIRLVNETESIDEIIERLKGMTLIEVSSKNLVYNFDIEKGLTNITIDKERLEQILINLVNNAVKYTDEGSITVGAHKEGNKIHFYVKDTGVGIPKKDIEKIFERFYQVESHLTRKVGGAGLGLSICQEIVKIMGGKIWAESEVNKGSSFHILFPINHPISRIE